MDAQMRTETVGENTNASEICLTKDLQKIEGVQLASGKFCQCPASARYFDANKQKCLTAEEVNADGNLTFDTGISYGDK